MEVVEIKSQTSLLQASNVETEGLDTTPLIYDENGDDPGDAG